MHLTNIYNDIIILADRVEHGSISTPQQFVDALDDIIAHHAQQATVSPTNGKKKLLLTDVRMDQFTHKKRADIQITTEEGMHTVTLWEGRDEILTF